MEDGASPPVMLVRLLCDLRDTFAISAVKSF